MARLNIGGQVRVTRSRYPEKWKPERGYRKRVLEREGAGPREGHQKSVLGSFGLMFALDFGARMRRTRSTSATEIKTPRGGACSSPCRCSLQVCRERGLRLCSVLPAVAHRLLGRRAVRVLLRYRACLHHRRAADVLAALHLVADVRVGRRAHCSESADAADRLVMI